MQTQQKIAVNYRKDESLQQFAIHANSSLASAPRSINQQGHVLNLENALLGKRGVHNRKFLNLKQVITKNKVTRLVNNFTKKLRLNTANRVPLENLQDHKNEADNNDDGSLSKFRTKMKQLGQRNGLTIHNSSYLLAWHIVNTLQTIMMVFILSIMMTFQDVNTLPFVLVQVAGCLIYLLDLILNFLLQRYECGKKLQTIGEIYAHYIANGFLVDFMSILFLVISLLANHSVLSFLGCWLFLVKMISCVRKLEKYEYLLISTNQKEHYYGLIKVFLTNFAIGHFLSIFLNLMAGIDPNSNWQTKLGLQHSSWSAKYIWGYYWGTNIMLTVGFGDITATNQYQAIILVFIQTFSCITLAYNISYVGALISSIRENEQSKKKKLKIFHRMCKENQIQEQIQSKISNFIEESYQIRQNFQHEIQDEVIECLPKQMKSQYRKEANKVLFVGLGFLSNLSKKSLLTLAEEVNRKICHPEEIIVKKGSISDFYVLQSGFVAFACKTRSELDGKVIETLSAEGKQKPKILSLDFIKNKTSSYNIKSLNYSVLYFLSRQSFMQSLKGSQMDYQLFCLLKDKDEYILNENCLYPCPNCKNQYHNKLECTKLHFIPLKQHVIFKYLNKSIRNSQKREKFFRNKNSMTNIFHNLKDIEEQQQNYIQDNYDSDHYREIQELLMFYKKIPKNNDNNNSECQENNHILSKRRSSAFATHIGMKTLLDEKAIHKLEQLLERKKQNGFWELEVDIACDFSFYFKEGNPEALGKAKKLKKHKNGVSMMKSNIHRHIFAL